MTDEQRHDERHGASEKDSPNASPENGGAVGAVRAFHYSAGDSHKFWSIQVEGRVQTVHFGRIGGVGQTCTKEFPTPGEAQNAMEKLTQQKHKKGYVEVSPEEVGQVAPKKRVPKRAAQQLVLPF